MFRISKNLKNPVNETKEIWYQPYTDISLKCSNRLKQIINSLLFLNTEEPSENEREFLLQVVAAELVERGFLVPDNVPLDKEEEYLSYISPFHMPSAGFFGFPTAHYRAIPDDADMVIFGVPCDLGAGKPGSRLGPSILRNASFSYVFRGRGPFSVVDLSEGKRPFDGKKIFDIGDLTLYRKPIDLWIRVLLNGIEALPKNVVPVMIGGDHTFTFPAVVAVQNRVKTPITLFHFDSHQDIQVWGDFKNNRPVSLDPPVHSNFISHIKERSPYVEIYQIGIRNYLSIQENKEVGSYINNIVSKTISDLDFMTKQESEINSLLPVGRKAYISLDVDVLNRSFIESTGYPTGIGLSYQSLLKTLDFIISTNDIVGMDIVELGGGSGGAGTSKEAELINYILLRMVEKCLRK